MTKLAAAAAVAVLLLTGCSLGGTETGTDESPAASDGLLPAAEGTTEYPLTLTTAFGETVLEERPERIAVIGFSPNLDALQALDVTPVYALTEDAWEWRDEDWLAGIEYIDTADRTQDTNYEAIAATDPDLIIALGWIGDEQAFEKLSAIAPVLDNDEVLQDNQVEWQQSQRLVGEALDLSAAADEAIEDAEAAIAAVADEHPEFTGKTITIGQDYGPEYGLSYYIVAGGTAEAVMLELGFDANPLAEQFVDDAVVPDENMAMLEADVLLMFYFDEDYRAPREEQPLFQALTPVVDGRYLGIADIEDENGDSVKVDGDGNIREGTNVGWVLRNGASAVSLPYAVDVIANDWLADIDLSE